MQRWVALLRGVNVNGITVKSAELAELLRSLGLADVRTILATGNAVFGADEDSAALKTRIEAGLAERFGYEAWIVLEPHERLAALASAYPFDEDAEHHAYVVFSSDEAALVALLEGPTGDDEEIAPGDGVAYWRCPKGASTGTPFAKHAAKARFKASTTTRNLNTVHKVVAAG